MQDDAAQGLAEQVDVAQWQWLRAHNERGALILVERMLELAEVGERVRYAKEEMIFLLVESSEAVGAKCLQDADEDKSVELFPEKCPVEGDQLREVVEVMVEEV